MDILNTFFVANIVATVAVLVAFFSLRDSVGATIGRARQSVARFNVAGAAGAATSMVVMASVATLFR
jgi:hypothetical protein